MRKLRGHFAAGLFLSVLVLTGAGCQSLPHCPPAAQAAPGPTNQYVLELNADGFLFDLGPNGRHREVSKPEWVASYLETNIVAGFRRSGLKKMLLFVHGGLLERDQALLHFAQDYQGILEAGYYPIFVIWPSGWSATYREHLFYVRQGIKADLTEEKIFSFGTSPFVLLADTGRAVTRLPLVLANNTRSELETLTAATNWSAGRPVRQYAEMRAAGYPVMIGDDYSRQADRNLRGLTYGVTLPFKYLFSSCLDGFGKGAWDDMLRRTQEVYPARMDTGAVMRLEPRAVAPGQPVAKKQRRQRVDKEQGGAPYYPAPGLPMLVERLRRVQGQSPGLEISLVGHSMGTIVLNRMLRDSEMDFANVVYMGAACTIDDFASSALPYLRTHRQANFYNLCLHPVAEAGEWQDWLADLPPRGSLLVWIDNFFANPVHERERTFGRWRNLFREDVPGQPMVRQFYDNDPTGTLKERLHFQAFSVGFGNTNELRAAKHQWNDYGKIVRLSKDDRCNNPLSHGELSEMPYWDPHFWWPDQASMP